MQAHFLSREPPAPGSFFKIPQNALDRFTRETDGTGIARFPNLPQGYRVRLRHLDDRFAQVAFEDDIRLAQDSLTQEKPIRLLAGASITLLYSAHAAGALG